MNRQQLEYFADVLVRTNAFLDEVRISTVILRHRMEFADVTAEKVPCQVLWDTFGEERSILYRLDANLGLVRSMFFARGPSVN